LCSLRFGQRAKLIKNKAVINKQLTVEECKRIIEELQTKLEFANARIEQLENFIRKNGLQVPSEDEVTKLIRERVEGNPDQEEDDVPLTEAERDQLAEEKQEANK